MKSTRHHTDFKTSLSPTPWHIFCVVRFFVPVGVPMALVLMMLGHPLYAQPYQEPPLSLQFLQELEEDPVERVSAADLLRDTLAAPVVTGYAVNLERDYRALVALYASTNGDSWNTKTHWDTTLSVSDIRATRLDSFYGVTASSAAGVTAIDLHVNNLGGLLPPALGNLSALQVLSLNGNYITGPIPPALGNLSALQVLNLSFNRLTGPIPPALGNLSALQVLNLSFNEKLPHENYGLTGPIPPELGNLSALQVLDLEFNRLWGPLPPEIGNLSALQVLDLSLTDLTGPIPPALGNLSALQVLDLSRTDLTGPIPPALGNLSELQALRLDGNSLTGPIPPALGNLSELQELDLGYNYSLTGPIPPDLGNLSALRELDLSYNSLTGPLPPALGNLSELQELRLYDNDITGPLPPEIGNLSELQELWLYDNDITGPLPPEIGNLSELQELRLYDNDITGPLPPALGNLSALQDLNLHNNSLTGPLPTELGNLSALQALFLSNNSLTGPLPTELGNLSALEWLNLSDNSLAGVLPRSLMQLDSLNTFYFGGQELCAPADSDFQAWLSSIPSTDGPTCAPLQLTGTIANQTFRRAQPIAPLVLPEASGGVSPINYTLAPTLPTGLSFDSATRTISGTPTEVTQGPLPYTYTATDTNGSADSLHFTIEVFGPLAAEHETLPESFAVHGNYPNPFRAWTRIVFDLPWPARVTVEVMDLTGRRVLAIAPVDLSAGWAHNIAISGLTLSSGLYLYRLMAAPPESHATYRMGRFVHIR